MSVQPNMFINKFAIIKVWIIRCYLCWESASCHLEQSMKSSQRCHLSFRKWLGVHHLFTGIKENKGILEIGNSMCRAVEMTKSLACVGNCKYFTLVAMLDIFGGDTRQGRPCKRRADHRVGYIKPKSLLFPWDWQNVCNPWSVQGSLLGFRKKILFLCIFNIV